MEEDVEGKKEVRRKWARMGFLCALKAGQIAMVITRVKKFSPRLQPETYSKLPAGRFQE